MRSQATQERHQAFKQALWDVLVKVTGNKSVPAQPEVQALFLRATQLVQQYRYQELLSSEQSKPEKPVFTEELVDTLPEAEPTHKLLVQFAKEALNRHLTQLGIPVWGRERPATLVWLAVEEHQKPRYLMSGNTESKPKARLEAIASLRGLPILLPLMDFEDRSNVRFADIRGNFSKPVLDGSMRYGVESVLTGVLVQDPKGRWIAQWTVYRNGQANTWRTASPELDENLLSGIQGVAGVLAAELGTGGFGAQEDKVALMVHDIRSLQDYARVVDYLSNLSVVEAVQVSQVNEDKLRLDLQIKGSRRDLERGISQGGVLVAALQAATAEADLLNYSFLH